MDYKNELKAYLKYTGQPIVFKEEFTDEYFTITINFKGDIWSERLKYYGPKDKSVQENEVYGRLLFELMKTPEQRESERAFIQQWMHNIQNNIGDAYGETIPSNKQVLDRLKFHEDKLKDA